MPSQQSPAGRIGIAILGATAVLLLGAAPALAQEPVDGEAIYQSNCAACHQPDGSGIPGTFPPLQGNPNIDDASYVADVIANGLSGEIEVDGTIYDGQMPAISLSEAETDAVIAYIQGGFESTTPAAAPALIPETDDGFPWGTAFLFATAAAVAWGVIAIAYPPGEASSSGRRAWGVGITVFLYFGLTTVWLPSHLLEDPALGDWPDLVRDGFVSAVWLGALGAGIVGLRWAQRKGRI